MFVGPFDVLVWLVDVERRKLYSVPWTSNSSIAAELPSHPRLNF
jgi:hypothetical protein